jgi:hypothetical protein
LEPNLAFVIKWVLEPWVAEAKMTYNVYIVGPDGHIQGRVDLICANDDAAKERALLLVDGHDLEVWQGDRKVTTLARRAD